MLNNNILLMIWWPFYEQWWSCYSSLLLHDVPTLFGLRKKFQLNPHLHLNKGSLNMCTAVQGLFLVPFNVLYMNQKPSLSSSSFFFSGLSLILSFRSSSECRACVSEGSTHDSECVQPAITEWAVHDVLSHLACCQNTFFSFHTSLRAVSTGLFSWILSCAFKPVKSKKSLLIWHIEALNGKTP